MTIYDIEFLGANGPELITGTVARAELTEASHSRRLLRMIYDGVEVWLPWDRIISLTERGRA